jgi:hypothetical protein
VAKNSFAADKPCWTEPPVVRSMADCLNDRDFHF